MRQRLRAAPFAALLLCLLWLGGCASRLPEQQRAQLVEHLPETVELRDVPFYPQELYQCGPAALATVLNHHRHPVSPDSLVAQIYIPERHGSLQIEMKAATRSHGLLAFDGPSELHDLLAEIAAERPVIVLQNLGLEWAPQWHYAVAVGYDLATQQLILRSGTEKRRLTPLALFERTWARGDHWSLLALPPPELPLRIAPTDAIRTALELEPVDADASRLTLAAASQRWPDNYLAQMAHGNGELGAGQADNASAAFRQALRLQPGDAAAWNNLAYSLAAEGCQSLARAAVSCARALAPDSGAIADSLRELFGQANTDTGQCPVLPLCPAASGRHP